MQHDLALEQMVLFPTRGQNKLDLLFTSHPTIIDKCKALSALGSRASQRLQVLSTPSCGSLPLSRRKTSKSLGINSDEFISLVNHVLVPIIMSGCDESIAIQFLLCLSGSNENFSLITTYIYIYNIANKKNRMYHAVGWSIGC
jgi:hypothetical protein